MRYIPIYNGILFSHHEIKRCLLLGRKAMTNLDSILKSRVLQAINAGEGVEKREPSYTVGGNAN